VVEGCAISSPIERNKHGLLFEIRTISKYLEQNHNVGKSKQMFERCQILARLCTVYADSLHTREKGESKGRVK
jgi:hypothetical protein